MVRTHISLPYVCVCVAQTSMARKVAQVENNIQSTMQKVAASDWKAPILMVLLLIAACMLVIYRWYTKLRKSHIF